MAGSGSDSHFFIRSGVCTFLPDTIEKTLDPRFTEDYILLATFAVHASQAQMSFLDATIAMRLDSRSA